MPDKDTKFNNPPDFSGYFTKPPADTNQAIEPMDLKPKKLRFSKKLKYLILILILLAIAEAVFLFTNKKPSPPPVPEGYEYVSPPGTPPNIAPIKH